MARQRISWASHARNRRQSAYPSLWPDLGYWVPSLGATGLTLIDVSGRKNHGWFTTADPSVWQRINGVLGIQSNTTDTAGRVEVNPQAEYPIEGITVVTRFRVNATFAANSGLNAYRADTNSRFGMELLLTTGAAYLKGSVRKSGVAYGRKAQPIHSPEPITLDVWHTACMTVDPVVASSANIRLYLNGRRYDESNDTNMPLNDTDNTFMIGGTNTKFDGDTALTALYRGVLPESAIAFLGRYPDAPLELAPQHFPVGAGGGPPSTVASPYYYAWSAG